MLPSGNLIHHIHKLYRFGDEIGSFLCSISRNDNILRAAYENFPLGETGIGVIPVGTVRRNGRLLAKVQRVFKESNMYSTPPFQHIFPRNRPFLAEGIVRDIPYKAAFIILRQVLQHDPAERVARHIFRTACHQTNPCTVGCFNPVGVFIGDICSDFFVVCCGINEICTQFNGGNCHFRWRF